MKILSFPKGVIVSKIRRQLNQFPQIVHYLVSRAKAGIQSTASFPCVLFSVNLLLELLCSPSCCISAPPSCPSLLLYLCSFLPTSSLLPPPSSSLYLCLTSKLVSWSCMHLTHSEDLVGPPLMIPFPQPLKIIKKRKNLSMKFSLSHSHQRWATRFKEAKGKRQPPLL